MIAVTASAWIINRTRERITTLKEMRFGRDGERMVANRLDDLKETGWIVLHDITAGSFNIDHVLIGPTGIYCCETKTYRKAGGEKEHAVFDGEKLQVRGYATAAPITQARRNAKWLVELLQRSTGRTFHVTPALILPGWYIEQPKRGVSDVMILNDHANTLRGFLEKGTETLPETDRKLVAFHLDLFVRAASGAN